MSPNHIFHMIPTIQTSTFLLFESLLNRNIIVIYTRYHSLINFYFIYTNRLFPYVQMEYPYLPLQKSGFH